MEIIKHIEDDIGENLDDCGFGDFFFYFGYDTNVMLLKRKN